MTKIIAHRGAQKVAPQNTIPAFKIAREMGAHGFENDVHFTADGYIVVHHNYSIEKTSNGEGLILEMTLEELRKYDFGSYFSDKFAGTKIPTLEEFFEVSKGLEVINVEIKTPLDKNYKIAGAVIDMAKKYGVFDELIISSFDENVLLEAHSYDPVCKTGFLYDPKSTRFIDEVEKDPIAYAKKLHAAAIHPVFLMIDEELIKNAHANGIQVNAWTVNIEDTIDMLIDMEIDGIITDVPDIALQRLKLKKGN